VFQQLLQNLVVEAAPKLATAQNGTLVMTHGKQSLVLEIRWVGGAGSRGDG
jgi:hypothetical protein